MAEQREPIPAAEAQGEPIAPEAHSALGQVNTPDEKRHLDFFTSLVLMGICVWVIVTSQGYYQQQLKRKICSTFYESTGFMPTVFAGFLLVMSLLLLLQSLKGAGLGLRLKELGSALRQTLRSQTVYKALGGLAIFAVYIYFLLGRMYFGVASVLVLFATLLYAYFDRHNLPRVLLKSVLISVLSVAGIVALFQYAFSVPMP